MTRRAAARTRHHRAAHSRRTRCRQGQAKGKVGGRPSVVDAKKLATINKLVASGDHSRADTARMTGVSQATLYRMLSTL